VVGWGNVAELVNSGRGRGPWFVESLSQNVRIGKHESSRGVLTGGRVLRRVYGMGWVGGSS